MVKQLLSKDIKKHLGTNDTKILLDVRTKGEWDTVGKPDGEKIGLKTYFLEIRRDALFDFVKEFKDFKIEGASELTSLGMYRPLAQKINDLKWKMDENNYPVFDFWLHKGTYATSLLREIMKSGDMKVY